MDAARGANAPAAAAGAALAGQDPVCRRRAGVPGGLRGGAAQRDRVVRDHRAGRRVLHFRAHPVERIDSCYQATSGRTGVHLVNVREVTGAADSDGRPDRYKWIALSNTTLSMTMATIDASIVIISMPAIFRGIHLDPLAAGNITYLLWMIIGYLLVQSVLVVTLGRLGDMFGRVRIYNLGFVVFTLASVALSLDPLTGPSGALWLIGWRFAQAFGGAMLMSNSAAILTDAFPANKRGMALGVNQI